MTVYSQLLTLSTMILSGIYLGMALETFRRFDHWWKKRNFFKHFMEISFWISQTCILFYVLYYVNYGELRFYMLIACALGYSIYKLMLQALYRSVLAFCINVVNIVLITPIVYLIKVVYTLLYWLYQCVMYLVKFIGKVLLVLCKAFWSVCKRLIPEIVFIKISQMTTFCSTIITNYKKSD